MFVRVLGSAAGGGLPQWNCGCPNCRSARSDDGRVVPRTQSSVAVSADGERWILLNASPDLRQQINAFDDLGPGARSRGTGIASVVVTDAELDHSLGLLLLRESDSLVLYTTPSVRATLTEEHPVLPTLDAFCDLEWRPIEIDGNGPEAPVERLGIECTAFALPGDPPLYSGRAPAPGDVIGLELEAESGQRLVYAPAVAAIDDRLYERIAGSTVTLLDGTFWSNDEMIELGAGTRSAVEMHHLPISGSEGSLARLTALDRVRLVFIHINNTNPILAEDSRERRAVEAAGFELAHDGMSIRL